MYRPKPSRFQMHMAELAKNPDNADALYNLSLCYRYAWGTRENIAKAERLLQLAAEKGCEGAITDLQRRASEDKALADQRRLDRDRLAAAKTVFVNKTGLVEAVKQKVMPSLVIVHTRNGRVGSAFFQHTDWLVSNAHVLPCRELLDITSITDWQGQAFALQPDESYHRPSERHDSPDVVVIKTGTRGVENMHCLPTGYSADADSGQRYLFYVDLHPQTGSAPTIKFLQQVSPTGVYPLVYRCADGSEPEPGSSGSAIIEARVMQGRMPQWQFKVVGALYARCSADWYSREFGQAAVHTSKSSKLVCAIPVLPEFLQILDVLRDRDMGQRHGDMSAAYTLLGRHGKATDAAAGSADYHASAAIRLQCFEAGHSDLRIGLPEGLEKLWYSGIVAVSDSLLAPDNLKKAVGRKAARSFTRVPQASEAVLQADFAAFIAALRKERALALKLGDGFRESPSGHFRVDITGGAKEDWKLDIQDNTGKYSHNKKSLSSVFAIVKVPKSTAAISGERLAELFAQSQAEKQGQTYTATPQATSSRRRSRRR